jgi:hypothetical protein
MESSANPNQEASMTTTLSIPIGTRVQDTLGNTGTVVRYFRNYSREGYVIDWDGHRFGKPTSMLGPGVVKAL